jgi:hypothetical protein
LPRVAASVGLEPAAFVGLAAFFAAVARRAVGPLAATLPSVGAFAAPSLVRRIDATSLSPVLSFVVMY